MNTFIARNGEQIGSWPEEQVRDFHRSGSLLPTDAYWQEGMAEWQPLANLPGLTAASISPALPQPPPAPRKPNPAVVRDEPAPSRLTWFIPFLLAVIFAVLLKGGGKEEEAVAQVGRVIGGVIFFLFLAFLVSLPFRRSWRLGIRCGVILILAALAAAGLRRQADIKVVDEMTDFANAQLAKARERVAHPGSKEPMPDIGTETAKLKTLSQNGSPMVRAATDATVEMMQEIANHSKACRVAEQHLLGLGLDPARLTSLEEVQTRYEAAQACSAPIQDFLDYLGNLDKELRTKLASRGLSATEIDQYIAGLHTGSRLENIAAYWHIEQDVITDLASRIELLKTQWGKWHITTQGALAFDDSNEAAAYNELTKKIQAGAAEEKSAHAKILAPLSQ